jgi:hypothetical protein
MLTHGYFNHALWNRSTMSVLTKLLDLVALHRPHDDFDSSDFHVEDIAAEYVGIIRKCFTALLVPLSHVEIDVRELGTTPEGRISYAAFVRMTRWDPQISPLVLVNSPVMERSIRKMVSRHAALASHSQFIGLWLRTPSQLEGAPSCAVREFSISLPALPA